jgi:hypothetical protein
MSMSAMSETDVESDVDIDGMPYSPSLTAVTCHSPPPGSPLALAKKGMKGVIPVLELDGGHDDSGGADVGMDKGGVGIEGELEEGVPGEGTSARRDELAEEEVHEEEKVSDKGVVDDGDNDKSVDDRLNSEAAGDSGDAAAAEDVVDSGYYSSLSGSTDGFDSSAKFLQLDQSRLWNRRRRGGGDLLPSVPSESQEACSSTTAEVASLEGNVSLKMLSYCN